MTGFSPAMLAAMTPEDMRKLVRVMQILLNELPQKLPAGKAVDAAQKSVVGATPEQFDASIGDDILNQLTRDKSNADVMDRAKAFVQGAVTALTVFG